MFFENLTKTGNELLAEASKLALTKQSMSVEPEHLFLSLLEKENTLEIFFEKKGIKFQSIKNDLEIRISSFLKISQNIISRPALSQTCKKIINNSIDSAFQRGEKKASLHDIFLSFRTVESYIKKYLEEKDIEQTEISEFVKIFYFKREAFEKNAGDKKIKGFTKNLNKLAKTGKLDPVFARDEEIRKIIQVLSRRSKNNPILVGESGVGKTAVIEGLANRIVNQDVPDSMKNKVILQVDLAGLIAGTRLRGEFEKRLKDLIDYTIESNGKTILFIDEAHNLLKTGGSEGAMDASNILKPYLARGEIKMIGVSTSEEYRSFIQQDSAFERRFSKIVIKEPSIETSITIIRGLKEKYEIHHGIKIKDDAIIAAVKLSDRYICDRQLPDKAIDLIDECASQLKIQIQSQPVPLEKLEREILQLEIEKTGLLEEDLRSSLRKEQIEEELKDLKEKRNELKRNWIQEKSLIEKTKLIKQKIADLKLKIEDLKREGNYQEVSKIIYSDIPEKEKKLQMIREQMYDGEKDFLKEEICEDDIIKIISEKTSIPLSKILRSEKEKLLNLEKILKKQVIGQDHAIKILSDSIRRNRSGIHDEKRPMGVFMFLGASGVGKTQLSKTLAKFLFDDERAMIRIDMSEYSEKSSISKLIGAAPGYIGYNESNALCDKVKQNPYSLILLDEFEKAHKDISNLLLQVFDEGHLRDSRGNFVNFKNCIIIMTSNITSNSKNNFQEGRLLNTLKQHYSDEFLNRIDEMILFNNLGEKEMEAIFELEIKKLEKRLKESHGLSLELDERLKKYILDMELDKSFGARQIKRAIQKYIENPLAKKLIQDELENESSIKINLEDSNIKIRF